MVSFGCTVLLRKQLPFDKSGRSRVQIQNAFILCEAIFAEEIDSNWLMTSFVFAVTLRKRLVFDKSGRPRGKNQKGLERI